MHRRRLHALIGTEHVNSSPGRAQTDSSTAQYPAQLCIVRRPFVLLSIHRLSHEPQVNARSPDGSWSSVMPSSVRQAVARLCAAVSAKLAVSMTKFMHGTQAACASHALRLVRQMAMHVVMHSDAKLCAMHMPTRLDNTRVF